MVDFVARLSDSLVLNRFVFVGLESLGSDRTDLEHAPLPRRSVKSGAARIRATVGRIPAPPVAPDSARRGG